VSGLLQNRQMTLIGVDFGTRRIGLAVSESGVLATPLLTIEHGGNLDAAADRIAGLAIEYDAGTIVVGIPRGGRKSLGAEQEKFLRFAETLRQRTCSEVVVWDEAYSTTEALSLRKQSGRKGRTREPIDSAAAAVILQSYLDAAGRTP
jgi:putative holliday junction resolvase